MPNSRATAGRFFCCAKSMPATRATLRIWGKLAKPGAPAIILKPGLNHTHANQLCGAMIVQRHVIRQQQCNSQSVVRKPNMYIKINPDAVVAL